jgi:ribonuclease P protein subunit RPR2
MEQRATGVRGVVLERIQILFSLAEREAKAHPERSRRYVSLARRLATRFRIRLPPGQKRRYCRECNAFLVPGFNARVRLKTREAKLVSECLSCGAKKSIPYKGSERKRQKPGA